MIQKQSFKQWFLTTGWRSYLWIYVTIIPFVIYAMIKSIPDLLEAPYSIMFGGPLIVIGFIIGITAHMINAYKISKR